MSRSSLALSTRMKASLRRPREFAYFSTDIQGKVLMDTSSLSYYYLPEAQISQGIDLNAAYKDFERKDETKALHLDTMLEALISHEQSSGEKVKGDLITWRGIMTKILCLSYEREDDIDVNLVLFDGQIFMEEDHELTQQKKRKFGPRDEVMAYWGVKFEGIATLPKPWKDCSREEIEERRHKPVNNIEQYASIVRTGVGSVKVVLCGEVDGVYDYKPEDSAKALDHYMELKTTRIVDSPKGAANFERKIFKSWAQSFLIGVPKIIYGYRDDQGIVRSVEEFETEELPSLVNASTVTPKEKRWNGMDAIGFYGAAIEWIKSTMAGTTEGVQWRLEYRARSNALELYRMDGVAATFLLPAFVQWREQLNRPA